MMMMKKVFLYKYTFLAVLVFGQLAVTAQDFRKNKKETRYFKVGADAELKIQNKYGKIELIPWDKDSIKFEVSIDVRAKKEDKANEIINDIVIEYDSYQSYVESKTTFTSQDSFWGGMKDKTNSIFSGDNKTQIDYTVYIPRSIRLTLENKYGDIFMEDHSEPVSISLSNGDLRAKNLLGLTTIKLEFAYANIKQIEKGNINMDHRSELILDVANDLKIESKSSRVTIKEVKKLDLKSYRDKLIIGEVDELVADNAYTFLDINSLGESVSVTAKYGNINIGELGDEVSTMNITAEDTDIEIKKPESRSITIEAVYSEKAGLFFPSELVNKKTIMEDEEKKLVKTVGMVGEDFASPIKLTITLPSGNLRIR
jgi:hypothetical protein